MNITTPSVIATKQTCFTKVWHFVVHYLIWENIIYLCGYPCVIEYKVCQYQKEEWFLAEYENKRLNSENIQQDVVDSTKYT